MYAINMTALVPAEPIFLKCMELLRPVNVNGKVTDCEFSNSCVNSENESNSEHGKTGACVPELNSIHEHIKQICLIPLTVLIIGINVCVLMVIIANRKFHNTTYMLIAALGVADLCVGFVSIGTLITKASEKTLELCLIRTGFTIAACVDSLLVLMLVAIDRYVAVFKGLRYHQIVTRGRTIFGISLVTSVSLVFGFLPLMGWRVPVYNKYCSFMYVVPANYIILLFSTCVLVPIVVMLYLYARMFKSARVHIKRIESIEQIVNQRASTGQLRISPRTAKSLKTLSVVFGCVLTTWMPFLVTSVAQIVCGDDECFLKEIVGTHLLILGFSNSFLNPVIYALGTRDFREQFIHTCFGRLPCVTLKSSKTNIYPVIASTKL